MKKLKVQVSILLARIPFVASIRNFLALRKQKKNFERVRQELLSNPIQLKEAQDKFKRLFGLDTATRTKKQWQNLVRVYGMRLVCLKEGMTEEQVNRKCSESLKESLEGSKRAKVVSINRPAITGIE